MIHLFFIVFVLLFHNNLGYAQNDLVDLTTINLKMDKYQFQYNCLETALKANPDKVFELYINKIYCFDDLKAFPKEVLKFKNLRILIIRHPIKFIPEEISKLQKLQVLIIWGGEINELPKNIGSLKNLRHLDIRSSNLSKLPKSFADLDKLEELGLSRNKFKEIPSLLGSLKKLKFADLYFNPLKKKKNCVLAPNKVNIYVVWNN